MKLMYLTFQEDAPLYMGVKNKIEGQVSALERLGFQVTYTMWEKDEFKFLRAANFTKHFNSSKGIMKQLTNIANHYLEENEFDVLYLRLDRISFDFIDICKTARLNKVKKIIVEIPNYPYLTDYIRNVKYAKTIKNKAVTAAKVTVTALIDRLSGLSLKKYVDAVVLYGNKADYFFGVKSMNGDNGINIDRIEPVKQCTDINKDISILGVAGTLWWQGYDRILEGMSIYKKSSSDDMPKIRFVLVGGDKTEMPEFKKNVEKLGLKDDVTFCGFKKGKELSDIYKTVDVGASTLGCYRRGLNFCSSLKAREYCAAALPFIYAYEDAKLNDSTKFALRIPNDETPVDINTVVDFVQNCRKNPNIAKNERIFAEENYDWKTIMNNILVFAGIDILNRN